MNSNTTDEIDEMPKEIKLNSCDHFQLLFDYKIKKDIIKRIMAPLLMLKFSWNNHRKKLIKLEPIKM